MSSLQFSCGRERERGWEDEGVFLITSVKFLLVGSRLTPHWVCTCAVVTESNSMLMLYTPSWTPGVPIVHIQTVSAPSEIAENDKDPDPGGLLNVSRNAEPMPGKV